MAGVTSEIQKDAESRASSQMSWISYIQKDLPEHLEWWPYTLGAIPLTLFGLLVVSGLLLTFYYVPSPDKAYESVVQITNAVYLGWFVRGVHKLSVDLMMFFLLCHVIRVFLTRAYRSPGELKWVTGTFILFAAFAMGFTGYALVYDNVSYWGMTVVTNMLGSLPVVGMPLLYLLRGGEEVSELTLLRLYDLHTKLVPILLGALIVGHIVAVRLLGFAEVRDSRHLHPFYPGHTLKMGMIAAGLLLVIVDLVMIFPPTVGPPANIQEVATDVSPPWYFSAPYMWITLLPGPLALWSLLAGAAVFVIYPFLDRALSDRGWPMAWINALLATLGVAWFVVLMVLDARG